MDYEEACDILIVGGGLAGASAALTAAPSNLKISGIDKGTRIGGTVRRGGGGFCVAGSAAQDARGIADSPLNALNDLFRNQDQTEDRSWARFYFRAAPQVVEANIARLGLAVEDVVKFERDSVARWHFVAGGGRAVADALERQIGVSGLHDCFRFGYRLTEFVADSGGPVGAVAENADGDRLTIRAAAIVLATGGFAGSPDLIAKHAQSALTKLAAGGRNATGDALPLLERIGADFMHLDRVYGYGFTIGSTLDANRGVSVRGLDQALWLNADLERFIDETSTSTSQSTAQLVAGQPGGFCWAIFDQTARDRVIINDHLSDDPEPPATTLARLEHTSPDVIGAARLADLATGMGVKADSLVAVVDQWNRRPADSRDHGTAVGQPPLKTIITPPFTAIRLRPGARKTLGGVSTDRCGRVLAGGRPVPGLYAAGEVAGFAGGNITGSLPLEGMMVGGSLFSGVLAGRHAVRDLARRRISHVSR